MSVLPSPSNATQQTVAWQKAFQAIAKDLDASFSKLSDEISKRCSILDKPVRVKVAAWLKKLSEEVGRA